MTLKITHEDVLTYLGSAEEYGGIPANNFKAASDILMALLPNLQWSASDETLRHFALHLEDNQRSWLRRLAQAANSVDDASIPALLSEDAYHTQKEPRFGGHNPQLMDMPFWKLMIRRSWSAWHARSLYDRAHQEYMRHLDDEPSAEELAKLSEAELLAFTERRPRYEYGDAVWSFQRFGITRTYLPDGREIWIAGEHEDWYDPDFYIYNDVIVIHPDLLIDIYGYPREVFRPTDFHSATLVGNHIYIIGCLGHYGTRQPGVTPVYRLDCQTFQIEAVVTQGDNPGWIYEHQAEYNAAKHAIKITQGTVFLKWEGKRQSKKNRKTYWLDLATGEWTSGLRKRSKENGQ